MLLNRKSVELLAPAGTWDALVASVESGADAVYLGGKHFNMRMHEGEFNFDDALLKKAIDYAHEHGVRLYITLNNLISNEEIQALREMGLGLGGSLENVIVYNDEGWLNPLHFEDELVRHKILDVIGDLRLAGIIRGHVIAAASGHALNTQLAKEIAAAYAGR